MSVIKTFSKLLAPAAAALLLCAAPLSVHAAPASKKTTTTTHKKTTAKRESAQKSTAKSKTTGKSTSSVSKSKNQKSSKKTESTAKTNHKKTKKQEHTKKKTAHRTEERAHHRQTMVIGEKPATVQADTYSSDDADSTLERKKADDLLMSAMGLLGVSYRFGGSNPASGLDCSGFIQYIFREAMNVNLPRTAAAMSEVGVAVDKANLKPGDLVFFARGKRRVGHVGMYIGNGKFIHAPRTGRSIEIQSLDKPYYVRNYAGARRIPNANRAARFLQ